VVCKGGGRGLSTWEGPSSGAESSGDLPCLISVKAIWSLVFVTFTITPDKRS